MSELLPSSRRWSTACVIVTVVLTATAMAPVVRAQVRRPHADPARPHPGRARGTAPAGRRSASSSSRRRTSFPATPTRPLFNLVAPRSPRSCALGAAAVVPFSPSVVAADLDVGVLYVLAIGGGDGAPGVRWQGGRATTSARCSAGCAAVAQSVSYEVPLLLAAMVPGHPLRVAAAGRHRAASRPTHHWFVVWPFFLGIPAFVLFMLAMLAESNRIPFDIPEAESELVAGVTTEYTGMKFAPVLPGRVRPHAGGLGGRGRRCSSAAGTVRSCPACTGWC